MWEFAHLHIEWENGYLFAKTRNKELGTICNGTEQIPLATDNTKQGQPGYSLCYCARLNFVLLRYSRKMRKCAKWKKCRHHSVIGMKLFALWLTSQQWWSDLPWISHWTSSILLGLMLSMSLWSKTGNLVTVQVSPAEKRSSYSVMDGAQGKSLGDSKYTYMWLRWCGWAEPKTKLQRQVCCVMWACANAQFESNINVISMTWNEGDDAEIGGQGEIKLGKKCQKTDRKRGRDWNM